MPWTSLVPTNPRTPSSRVVTEVSPHDASRRRAHDRHPTTTSGAAIGAALRRAAPPVLAPLVVLVILIVAWWAYAQSGTGALFPTPQQTLQGFIESISSSDIWGATLISWRSLAIGYGISILLGVPLGLLLGYSRAADKVLGVYLDISLVTPMVVMMPIILIALGITLTAEVVVIIFFALPYVTLPIRNGVRGMPQLWFDLSKSLCATSSQTWRNILLPGARRAIADGLRLGLGHALTGLLVVEFTLVALGIGEIVLIYRAEFDFGSMLGYLLAVMAQIVVMMTLIAVLMRGPRGARAQ